MMGQFIGFCTLAKREMVRVIRIWKQTIFPPILTTTLYFIIFGEVVGNRVGFVNGMPYADFVAPGFIMLGVIVNSFANSVGSVYLERYMNTFDILVASPMHEYWVIASFTCGSLFRGFVIGLINTLVASYFVDFNHSHLLMIFLSIFTTSFLFSGLGIFNAFFANSFDEINIVPTFVLTPLIYLGGVFYSLKMLSPFWQQVAHYNPILYICDLFRYAWSGFHNFNPNITVACLFSAGILAHIICGYLLRYTTCVRK